MSIRVALHHRTEYRYERPISLSPQIVRLRPAPHARMPIVSYSLKVEPAGHFVNWQQDPHANWVARYAFAKKTEKLVIEVDLVADIVVVNPFDFFIDEQAEHYPFEYEAAVKKQLAPFLEVEEGGELIERFVAAIDRSRRRNVDLIVDINQKIQRELQYVIRMEPGVQAPEQTLALRRGSCRDFAWLAVQVLRRMGLAARFVSGYSIQLRADEKSLDGPSGVERDTTDLHAWSEVYLPGAGWIGMDATCGLLAGEGYIPLAASAHHRDAAPLTGLLEPCESTMDVEMSVRRVLESPRSTLPYSDQQWAEIDAMGQQVDRELVAGDVRLSMGGEPTFISIDDYEAPEWTVAAVGEQKRKLSESLIRRLRETFAPGGLLHFGMGKWYPGEPLPRWALACFWRKDGVPMWNDPSLIADETVDNGHRMPLASRFMASLAWRLEMGQQYVIPAYEPPEKPGGEIGAISGYVLPLHRNPNPGWVTCEWELPGGMCVLIPGTSPVGLRLPIADLPGDPGLSAVYEQDPFEAREDLPLFSAEDDWDLQQDRLATRGGTATLARPQARPRQETQKTVNWVIRTALAVEPRGGTLHVFYPPVSTLEHFLELTSAIEATAAELHIPIVLEGYAPPADHRVNVLKVTPDPGVIEVNVHPVLNWGDLVENTTRLYEQARLSRLGTEKFLIDGRHTGTGGGNHVVFGGPSPADSPLLRRPDLLASLVTCWNNHPSLSYLFSGLFVGPTSQAPRVDEARQESVYELGIALSQIPRRDGGWIAPWTIDRILRNVLVDMTGNTHRAEFCIDKLFSPDSSSGRLGLLELRSFEMPPHARMGLAQQLLVRTLVAWFWKEPYRSPLIRWGTSIHDRFMLPHFIDDDLRTVVKELNAAGYAFKPEWFRPHIEFRFPFYGMVHYDGMSLELRQAIEPWHVLGEEPGGGATVRYVDSSLERLQVKVTGLHDVGRYAVACNGRRVPLTPTGIPGDYVAGVRFRAWQPPKALHPTIGVHGPLTFDLVDKSSRRAVAGCTYYVSHPAGRNYTTIPVNAKEAEARRLARFWPIGHTPGHEMALPDEPVNPLYPLTLDMRLA
ncbi:MAG: DUF2126 domain-containing protein [Tepidisphaerales bacterium]